MALTARNVQLSGSLQGGHGSATFDVYVDNAYLRPHHALLPGQWVTIWDSAHELYEGEVFSCVPVVEMGGQHKFVVTCGGLLSVAAKRMDMTKTWVHRGGAGWAIAPDGNKSGEYSLGNDGFIQLLVRDGATTEFVTPLHAYFVLDGGLSDDYVSHIDWTADWDVTTDTTYVWSWLLSCYSTVNSEANTSSTGESGSFTPGGNDRVVDLYMTGDVAHTTNGDRWVRFTTMDVYGSSKTAKVRIDEAMVDVAVRTGLATSSVTLPVGLTYDDLRVEKTAAAAALSTLAGLHAAPFEWAFWDNKTFYCRPIERQPTNPARVVVVGGPNPGLSSWDVRESDEDLPDYVCVYFGNKDDTTLPEGFVRRLYVPSTPPANADLVIKTADYSGLILGDAAAANIGASLLGQGTLLPADRACLDVHPEFADLSVSAGNNTDPTSSYYQMQMASAPTGTLTTFGYTAASGWAGSNTPVDPTCLVFDGASDYVTWGDVSWADFSTGDFSVACWFKLNAIDASHNIVTKNAGTTTFQGFKLNVSETNNLFGYCGSAAGSYRAVVHGTVLTTGVWYHAAMTWAGGSDAMKVYLNGLENVAYTFSSGTVGDISSTASLKLGAS